MADAFIADAAGSWTLIVETAYDREVGFALRTMPVFRAIVDKRPEKQAMPGDIVVLTLHEDIPTSVTPLVETVDPDAVAAVPPTRVNITINEYGMTTLRTIRLEKLAFSKPSLEVAELVARNQADALDLLVKNVLDTGTNVIRLNSGVVTTTGPRTSVAATDVFTAGLCRTARTILARNKAHPKIGDQFLAYAHPDVCHDIMAEAGGNTWSAPHTYVDTGEIYAGEVGAFMGVRYVETTRCVPFMNAGAGGTVEVFPTYFFGQHALAEATVIEPHVVVGPMVDSLKRFYSLGWHAMLGWGIYRQAALLRIETSSTLAQTVPIT